MFLRSPLVGRQRGWLHILKSVHIEPNSGLVSDTLLLSSWLALVIDVPPKGSTNSTYVHFVQFVYFVSECVKQFAPKSLQPKRLVLPLRPFGPVGDMAVNDEEDIDNAYIVPPITDIAMEARDPDSDWCSGVYVDSIIRFKKSACTWSDASYQNIVANAGVQSVVVKKKEYAYPYQFNMAAKVGQHQPNRRFQWGLMVEGTLVYLTLLGPGVALISNKMDLASEVGQEKFIRFLVNWAYCDEEQLGYDPSMVYSEQLKCWKLVVDTNDGQQPFNGYRIYNVADELYWRHPTYISAQSDTWPFDSINQHTSASKDGVTIKDYWPEGFENGSYGPCDEIKQLNNINRQLAGKREYKGMYPKLLCDGNVQVKGRRDTNRSFLGDFVWQQISSNTPLRAHRRIVVDGGVSAINAWYLLWAPTDSGAKRCYEDIQGNPQAVSHLPSQHRLN